MVNVSSSLHEVKYRTLTHAATSPIQNHTSRRPATWLAELARLPARALLALLWLYQRTLSPALPVIFGPSCGCRFAPTCSHYAVDAVREHGAFIGGLLALRRLIKCTPLHPGGFDPVPPRGKFSCTLIAHSPSAKADPRIA